jgi:hypothetical protein
MAGGSAHLERGHRDIAGICEKFLLRTLLIISLACSARTSRLNIVIIDQRNTHVQVLLLFGGEQS